MATILLNDHSYTVSFAEETVQLLPKEYKLFSYLFHRPNRTFSREELLNAVWPLEYPTDRTVDDHIYRLRKKLGKMNKVFSIRTIRGAGYQINMKQKTNTGGSTTRESHVDVSRLFSLYLGYGQGEALDMLARHQQTLGFQLDPLRSTYLQFMRGKLGCLVEESQHAFWEHAFYLLHIYSWMQPQLVIPFVHATVQHHKLPAIHQQELESYNMITFYLEAEQFSLAELQLQKVNEWIIGHQIEPLLPILHLLELQLNLEQGDDLCIEHSLGKTEEILARIPYHRETGNFYVLKGTWLLRKGRKKEAIEWIDKGILTLKQSQFTPHLLYAICRLDRYIKRHQLDPKQQLPYSSYWSELVARYELEKLEPKISHQLHLHL